jgi:hypothetical protein
MPMTAGPALVLSFVLLSAGRDLWFGEAFQDHDLFAVAFIVFAGASILFALLAFWRDARQFARLLRAWRLLVAANAATAVAWLSYFYALAHLEPAVVNTLHAGIGAATVLLAAGGGIRAAQIGSLEASERRIQGAILVTLVVLVAVVLSGGAGLAPATVGGRLLTVLAALSSGMAIALGLLATKRLNTLGIGSDGILASRFLAVVAVAGVLGAGHGTLSGLLGGEGLWIVSAGQLLIVLPIFLLQLGLARTAPITVEVLCATGPVLVFVGQIIEGRIPASPWVFAAILVYAGLTATGAALRCTGARSSNRLKMA